MFRHIAAKCVLWRLKSHAGHASVAYEAGLRKGAPEHLGGATRVTLGQCLLEYTKTISIHKKSCAQEIVYINSYLAAAATLRRVWQLERT